MGRLESEEEEEDDRVGGRQGGSLHSSMLLPARPSAAWQQPASSSPSLASSSASEEVCSVTTVPLCLHCTHSLLVRVTTIWGACFIGVSARRCCTKLCAPTYHM